MVERTDASHNPPPVPFDADTLAAARIFVPGPVPPGILNDPQPRVIRTANDLRAEGRFTPRGLVDALHDDDAAQAEAIRLLDVAALCGSEEWLKTHADAIVAACARDDAAFALSDVVARAGRLHPGDAGFAGHVAAIRAAADDFDRAMQREADDPTATSIVPDLCGVEIAVVPTPDVWSHVFRMGAIERGRIIGVGGMSGTGKTAMASWMILHAIRESPTERVLWLNLDMSHADLGARLMQGFHDVRFVDLLNTRYPVPDVFDAIHVTSDPTVSGLRRRIDRIAPSIVVVDMVQQLVPPGRERPNATESVDAAVRATVEAIRDAGATAFFVAQAAKTAGRAKTIEDAFRGSSTLLHSLDVGIVGVTDGEDDEPPTTTPVVRWRTMKNRIGVCGDVWTVFDVERLTFRPHVAINPVAI